jgi:uncharacterized coiled-coil DUF342 family protein
VEVLKQIIKKVNNNLKDENLVAGIKELKNENGSCMERVKQLEMGGDKHMEIIKCLEKENDIYRQARKEFFYVCFVVVTVYNVVGCLCCNC